MSKKRSPLIRLSEYTELSPLKQFAFPNTKANDGHRTANANSSTDFQPMLKKSLLQRGKMRFEFNCRNWQFAVCCTRTSADRSRLGVTYRTAVCDFAQPYFDEDARRTARIEGIANRLNDRAPYRLHSVAKRRSRCGPGFRACSARRPRGRRSTRQQNRRLVPCHAHGRNRSSGSPPGNCVSANVCRSFCRNKNTAADSTRNSTLR